MHGPFGCVQHLSISPMLFTWQNNLLLPTNETALSLLQWHRLHQYTIILKKQSYLAYKNAFLYFLWEWILLVFCTWTEGRGRLQFVCKTIFRYWIWLEGREKEKLPSLSQHRALGHRLLSCVRKCWSLNPCLSRLHIQLFYIWGGGQKSVYGLNEQL